jgi:hypothetical protein
LAGTIQTGFLACVFFIALAAAVPASEGTIAEGDGFVVTEEDIANLKAKFPLDAQSQKLNLTFYYTRALMMRLFAEEARAQGLGGSDIPAKGPLTFEQQDTLYEAYRDKLLADVSIDDIVIESYYRANPERFRVDPSQPAGEAGIRPFDEDVKKEARDYIVMRKDQRIETEAFERLKQKYHARFREPEKEKKEAPTK